MLHDQLLILTILTDYNCYLMMLEYLLHIISTCLNASTQLIDKGLDGKLL